jgi:hypothetical protein
MHAWRLRLKAERGIRRGEVERVGSDGGLNLFYRRLHDVYEGLQFPQRILRSPSVESIVKYLTQTVSTRGTYLAAESWTVDAAG